VECPAKTWETEHDKRESQQVRSTEEDGKCRTADRKGDLRAGAALRRWTPLLQYGVRTIVMLDYRRGRRAVKGL
jgi:hypothetical protein